MLRLFDGEGLPKILLQSRVVLSLAYLLISQGHSSLLEGVALRGTGLMPYVGPIYCKIRDPRLRCMSTPQ